MRAALACLATLCIGTATLPGQYSWPQWLKLQVPDSGIPETSRLQGSLLAVAGNAIYAFWNVDDPSSPMIWSRSLDSGRSWTPLAPFLPTPAPDYRQPNSVIAKDRDVLVQWDEWRPTGWVSLIAVSQDQGANWTVHPGPLHTAPDNLIDADGTLLWSSGAWLFSSPDRGATWQGPMPIGLAPVLGGGGWPRPLLRYSEGVLHFAWTAGSVGGTAHCYYARSADRGVTWSPAGRATNTTSTSIILSDLLCVPGAVILTWEDSAGVHVDRSLDGGVTWLPAPITLPAVVGSYPAFLDDGQALVAVWSETLSTGSFVVRCLRSPDHGATWSTTPTDIVSVPWGPQSSVSWVESRPGWLAVTARERNCSILPCVYIDNRCVSKDGGATWWGAGGALGMYDVGYPKFAADGPFLCGTWQNQMPVVGTYGDYQFAWFAGPRPLGGAAPGTGGHTPTLGLDSIPAFGFPSELRLTGGLPGAPALLALGTNRQPVPFLAGQLTIDPLDYLFLPLGSTTSPAPGRATWTFLVPPALLPGFSLQAFVLDPGAVGGVAITDGIEVRLY